MVLQVGCLKKIIFILLFSVTAFFVLPPHGMSETSPSLERFVLKDGDIPGYTTVKEPSYYNPGTLWNYINGGALPYLDYGVGDVVTFTGKLDSGGFEIVVDIYDMADSLGAFGIYSNERFPEYTYLDIGVEGYITENSFSFWKDRYYVKVFSSDASPQSVSPLESIARAVDKRIPEGGGMAVYFSLFPESGRLKKTESFVAKNVLGQDYLTNAFVVNYRRGEEEFQLYILETSDENDAAEKLRRYREFISEYGKLEKKRLTLGDDNFTGNESWYGLMVFVREGKYILGSVGLSDFNLAVSHLNAMLSELL